MTTAKLPAMEALSIRIEGGISGEDRAEVRQLLMVEM